MAKRMSDALERPTEAIRVLLVSRELATLKPMWSIVESNDWELETASNPWEALERIQSGVAPGLLVLDLPRGDGDSLHILRWLRRLRPALPTLMLCHPGDANKKSDAIRMGANEVLIRPFRNEDLEHAIFHYLSPNHDASSEMEEANVDALEDGGFFVSGSPVMNKLRAQAELLAQADVPVLITGEKGTGRKTLGRLIHQLSVRSGFRFSKITCTERHGDVLEKELFGASNGHGSSQAAAKFEIGEKGTIFLEEITEMSNPMQARLLSVLQDDNGPAGKICGSHPRVLASTSANVEQAIAEKRLREDLYYKLSAFTVHVPPLRQRKQEITLLLKHFMHMFAKHYGLPERDFSPQVLESCQKHWWPGNIAELETFVKRYLVAGDSDLVLNNLDKKMHLGIEPGSGALHVVTGLPGTGNGEGHPKSLKSLIQDIKCETEKNAIGLALEKTGWNRKAAARLLKVSYRTLLYKIDQYHMKSTDSFLSPLAVNGTATKNRIG